MKHYQITIDGRTFDVQVLGDPRQERVEVEVDGEVMAVEVRSAAPLASELAANKPVAEAVPEPAPMPGAGSRPGAGPRPAAATRAAAAPTASGGQSVRAPLPGVVKRIVVQPGQQVKPGETLLVIEAMKMDNAIRAMRGGVIEAVQVVEGRQVAHGDELLRYQS